MSELDNMLIATCGMNCQLCIGYSRDKNKCEGCNSKAIRKSSRCNNCTIKNCEQLALVDDKYCFNCEKYPCKRLVGLDKRYKEKYGMSMLANLDVLKKDGIDQLVINEKKKWTCSKCGNLHSVHRSNCENCGNINQYFGRYKEND